MAARQAVELSDAPHEGWLQLLVALHTMKEDYASARPVLEQLVTRFPKKQYWVQLSLIYGASDDYHESLAVQQLAYRQGLLVEDRELRRLARSYLYNEMSFQAARVLAQGLDDGAIEEDTDALELLGNSWISAREYAHALPPLQRAAAIADDGALYVRLGRCWSSARAGARPPMRSRRPSTRAASRTRAERSCSSPSPSTATAGRARPGPGSRVRRSTTRPASRALRGSDTSTGRLRIDRPLPRPPERP